MKIIINEEQLNNIYINELGISNELYDLYNSLTIKNNEEKNKWWIYCGVKDEDILHDFLYKYNIDLTNYGIDEYNFDKDNMINIILNKFPKKYKNEFIKFVKQNQGTILPPFLLLKKPKILKNNLLIHFANNSDSIIKNGFKYGINDFSNLTFSPRNIFNDDEYNFEMQNSGYNFGYDLNSLKKYFNGLNTFKYGNEAIILKTDCIKVHHDEDNENECIFWGGDAKILKVAKYNSNNKCWCCNNKCNANFYKIL